MIIKGVLIACLLREERSRCPVLHGSVPYVTSPKLPPFPTLSLGHHPDPAALTPRGFVFSPPQGNFPLFENLSPTTHISASDSNVLFLCVRPLRCCGQQGGRGAALLLLLRGEGPGEALRLAKGAVRAPAPHWQGKAASHGCVPCVIFGKRCLHFMQGDAACWVLSCFVCYHSVKKKHPDSVKYHLEGCLLKLKLWKKKKLQVILRPF